MLVAGTATPRPETWLELPRLELPRRVDGLRMPPVELLDMREADPRVGPAARRHLGRRWTRSAAPAPRRS